jgi:hypothetical protein
MQRIGLVDAMARAYGDPRGAMSAQLAQGPNEPRALFHLMLAAGLFFVASLPNAIREARSLAVDDALSGVIAAHLFGYLFVAPLIAYGMAALVHLLARSFGGTGGFLSARAAVFWAALLGAPIALALALIGVGAEVATGRERLLSLDVLGYASLGFWLWLFAASLAEAEGFSATRRVALAVGLAFGALAALLAVLSGRVAVA